jgi:hypothetical protein
LFQIIPEVVPPIVERWRRVGFLVDAALGLPARGVLWGPPLRFLLFLPIMCFCSFISLFMRFVPSQPKVGNNTLLLFVPLIHVVCSF